LINFDGDLASGFPAVVKDFAPITTSFETLPVVLYSGVCGPFPALLHPPEQQEPTAAEELVDGAALLHPPEQQEPTAAEELVDGAGPGGKKAQKIIPKKRREQKIPRAF
jgi:hypothetical protein